MIAGPAKKYPILSIEDGHGGYRLGWLGDGITVLCGRCSLSATDLFTTNIQQTGIEKGVANAVLIKLNQIEPLL